MMASTMIFSQEKRPLKRPKLGPPDVYPQDPRQREDELTAVNVKQGFSHIPQLSDEFGTAKNCNISTAKLGAFMNGALGKRTEANTFPDTGKRRLQVNTKDHFWHVTHTPRHKQVLEAWMRDLAGGKGLSTIAKKVPIFNKREEIFLTLAEHNVPMIRAGWFLKMTASYNSAISEAKTKKRQMPDPSQEWTISLARCCKDILLRVSDWYNGGTGAISASVNPNSNLTPASGGSSGERERPPSAGSLSSPLGVGMNGPGGGGGPNSGGNSNTIQGLSDDGSVSLKQWLYCMDLAKYLYEEGLLDRYEWLIWVIDMCDKTKSLDDAGWKALLPVMLSFLPDVAQSELLARRLATLSARKLAAIFTDQDFIPSPNTSIETLPPPMGLLERLKCPSHRPTVLGLCSAIQVVLLECPTAMVFNGNPMAPQSESGRNSVPGGSPLDILPLQPSIFPMPDRANNPLIRRQLMQSEDRVIARSKAVEAKWSCEEWQQSSAGSILQQVLPTLDALDRHNFDKIDSSNSLDTLYSQIFPLPPDKIDPVEVDAPIILLLCKWAVGCQRTGEHRSLVVARLLEHRQSDILSSSGAGTGGELEPNDKDLSLDSSGINIKSESPTDDDVPMLEPEIDGPTSNSSSNKGLVNGLNSKDSSKERERDELGETETSFPNGLPVFHNLLLGFLDSDAPILDESVRHSKQMFASLVNLFSSLIRHDIFSHDTYLCTLIARGDLPNFPSSSSSSNATNALGHLLQPPSSVQPIPSVSAATPGGGPLSQSQSVGGPATPASVSSAPSTTPHHDPSSSGDGPLFPPLPRMTEIPRQSDFDDPNIDDDLDRILQHITQDQMERDQVDSPKDDSGTSGHGQGHGSGAFGSMTPHGHGQNAAQSQDPLSNSTNSSGEHGGSNKVAKSSMTPAELKTCRHRQYVTHFQLPQDEAYAHEANQRHILLYGVGRVREEAKHAVKKVSKELNKLFSKKFCHDVSDGSRVKKHSKVEVNLDGLTAKFSCLPYYDQHGITAAFGQTGVEMFTTFVTGRNGYLPTVEHIGYLTDLMELGLNVIGLLELVVGILRELPDVEGLLCQRGSPLSGQYTTNMQLQLVGVLRRYHCCMLLDGEMTMMAWESLVRLMRRINSAHECSSAERCVLAYITELQTSVGFLRSKNVSEYLSPVAAKLRQSLCSDIRPSDPSSHNWSPSFMTGCLEFPKKKVETGILRQLIDSSSSRYSFVCNAVLAICNEADADRLNDLSSLCAEMTAACPALAAEWLGVLQTLCSPSSSRHSPLYADILSAVDVKHLSIHSNLATLTSLLVARQCFSLEDFVKQAVFSLLKAWNEGRGPHDPDTEAGARLTCQLLLSLFKTQEGGGNVSSGVGTGGAGGGNILKLSCDRRLLSATHTTITLGAVCAALKAMLLLADAAGSGDRNRREAHGRNAEMSISHILGTSDAPSASADRNNDILRGEPRTLTSFGYSALQQMCSEPWVRHRCLQQMSELCNAEALLDPMVSSKQAQRLLHLICYPEVPLQEEGLDPRTHIPRLMENLDQWNLREALLTLTLQNKQLTSAYNGGNSVEHGNWLDIVARAALDVFNLGGGELLPPLLHHDHHPVANSAISATSPAPGKSPRSGKNKGSSNLDQGGSKTPPTSERISSAVGGGGLTAGLNNLLNPLASLSGNPLSSLAGESSASSSSDGSFSSGGSGSSVGDDGETKGGRGKKSSAGSGGPDRPLDEVIEVINSGWNPTAAWLLAPLVTKLSSAVQGRVLRHAGEFLRNVLEAYFKKKSGRGHRNHYNGSLQAHLPFLALILTCLKEKDEQREGLLTSLLAQFTQILALVKLPEVDPQSDSLRDVLRLRLSLVGGMFDAIQRSSTATAEWAVVLTQLVTHGVVDLNNNNDIFPTVTDMVTALVHSTQIAEPGDRIEEMKRQNMNLIKKLKKELSDKDTDSIKPLRQLLPFSKVQVDIIVTTATSMIIDSKGNRVQSFEYVDKKPGLMVWEKQRVSPWEIIEGQKNPAQLSWGWFGAVKMERKPLRYEEAHRFLRFHNHNMIKPNSHFMEAVPLPAEDIDTKPEVHMHPNNINMKEEHPLHHQHLMNMNSMNHGINHHVKGPGDQFPMTMGTDQGPNIGILPNPPLGPGGRNVKPKPPRKRRQTKAQLAAAAAAAATPQQQQPPPPPIPPAVLPPPQMPPVPTVNSFNPPPVQNPNQLPPPPVPSSVQQNSGPPPNYPQGANPQGWYNGGIPNHPQQQPQQVQQQQAPPQQQQFFGQGPTPQQGPGPGRPPVNQSKQVLNQMLRARHHAGGMPPGPQPPNQFGQFQQNPGGGGGGPPVGVGPGPVGPRHQNILRQQLRGQSVGMQNQGQVNFQQGPGAGGGPPQQQVQQGGPGPGLGGGMQPNPNQGMMFQQQQQNMQPQQQQGMNQNYVFNQPNMGPGQGGQQGVGGPTLMNQQPQTNVQLNQMLGARGVPGPPPNQDISNFMQQGGGVRPQMGVGPAGPQQRSNFMQQQQQAYRPQQMQMGPGGGPGIGMGPGGGGTMGPGGGGTMGPGGQGQIMQQQNMMGPGPGGMVGQGQPGQVQGQMPMGVGGPGGMQNPNMTGVQRVRQFVMQQQQQQQQQQQGMGGPRMQQYQNQGPGPGGY